MKIKAQRECVLKHLEAHGRITQGEALTFYKCRRLAARICELREVGHEIQTVMVPSEDGNPYAEYTMEKKKAGSSTTAPAFYSPVAGGQHQGDWCAF